jgi:hypothetical protein
MSTIVNFLKGGKSMPCLCWHPLANGPESVRKMDHKIDNNVSEMRNDDDTARKGMPPFCC